MTPRTSISRSSIDGTNLGLRNEGFRALRPLETNLTPEGEGNTDRGALAWLDLVLGAFHSSCASRRTRPSGTSPRSGTQRCTAGARPQT